MAKENLEDKIAFVWQKYVEHIFKLRYRGGHNEDFIEAIENYLKFGHDEIVGKRLEIINANTVLFGTDRMLLPEIKVPEEYKKDLAVFVRVYGTDKFDI